MSWFEPDSEERRLAAHERLLLEATEAVCRALDERGMTRRQLASVLGVRPSDAGRNEVTRAIALETRRAHPGGVGSGSAGAYSATGRTLAAWGPFGP